MLSTLLAICAVAVVMPSWRFWERSRARTAPITPTPAAVEGKASTAADELLDLIDEGVMIVDNSLTPVMANRAARNLLGAGDVLPSTLPFPELSSIARRVVVERLTLDDVVEAGGAARRSLKVRAVYEPEGGGAVLLLRDISEDQRSQRVRRQFVMHASHELKSPIAAIQLLAEAVTDAVEGDPSQARRFATSLLQEARRLSMLVNDLLDLSRLEDPGTIANSVVSLSAVVSAECGQATPAASAKGISLKTSIEEDITVRGDDGQLALMIRNLLDNAIRYTPDQGQVSLEVMREGSDAVVRVTDDGIGIPLRDQARVFERFYRVDEGRSREQGGTGLGLAIVKHVADMHGGRVALSSQLGEGSTFTVLLPLLDATPAEGAR